MAAKREPRNATTSKSGSRFYTWRGDRFWSVTTILNGGIPKPVLVNWAKKFVAEYAVDHFAALTELVKTGDREGAVAWLKDSPYRDRDRAADIGTQVHAAAEAHRLGRPMPPWPLEIKPRMEAFAAWMEDFQPRFEAVEASVYHREQHYAGTLDAIVVVGGQRIVLDYKTARTGIYPEVALQLAAYRHAEFIAMPDGTEAPMPRTDGAAALWLPDDPAKTKSGRPYDFIPVLADRQIYRAFLYAREVYRWADLTSKTVLGAPLHPGLALALPEVADTVASLSGLRDGEGDA